MTKSIIMMPPGGGETISVLPPAVESMERKGWTVLKPKAPRLKAIKKESTNGNT